MPWFSISLMNFDALEEDLFSASSSNFSHQNFEASSSPGRAQIDCVRLSWRQLLHICAEYIKRSHFCKEFVADDNGERLCLHVGELRDQLENSLNSLLGEILISSHTGLNCPVCVNALHNFLDWLSS